MNGKFNEQELKDMINSLDNDQAAAEEKIRRLRCMRCGLLEEIHQKQQLLDKVDYIICRLRKDVSAL
ncbi:hypothetical protein [Ruminococcus sp. Marseille-P6503]|uniref:hypothetical protein n=1 Tax=Ruminococcus sp. Marseille-P6503 TaxID=2364796 RepID=UPI000F520264|nr:hypothetical protein [Ruminococcus sp. Marseille-P6503]